jgi:hypothetical protein
MEKFNINNEVTTKISNIVDSLSNKSDSIGNIVKTSEKLNKAATTDNIVKMFLKILFSKT